MVLYHCISSNSRTFVGNFIFPLSNFETSQNIPFVKCFFLTYWCADFGKQFFRFDPDFSKDLSFVQVMLRNEKTLNFDRNTR